MLRQLTLVVLLLCGCQSVPMEEFAEVHLNTVDKPLVLSADQPGLSANGDDYLFIAPVSVWHQHGTRHFLWLGYGSTIDRSIQGLTSPSVSDIVLMIDGAPMALTLAPWREVAPNQPYVVDVPILGTQSARVTLSQLERIVNGQALHAKVIFNSSTSEVTFLQAQNNAPDWSQLGVAQRP